MMDAIHQANQAQNTMDDDDVWGQVGQVHEGRIPSRRVTQQVEPVRDAWDDDDDDDELEESANAKELWEKANSSIPLPQIMLSSSAVPVPPPAALQGPLRILKRPNAEHNSSSSSLSSPQSHLPNRKSFEEREAQYQAARARIFGDTASDNSSADLIRTPSPSLSSDSNSRAHASPKAQSKAPLPKPAVIREPLGPTSGETTHGFTGRRKKGADAPDLNTARSPMGIDKISST